MHKLSRILKEVSIFVILTLATEIFFLFNLFINFSWYSLILLLLFHIWSISSISNAYIYVKDRRTFRDLERFAKEFGQLKFDEYTLIDYLQVGPVLDSAIESETLTFSTGNIKHNVSWLNGKSRYFRVTKKTPTDKPPSQLVTYRCTNGQAWVFLSDSPNQIKDKDRGTKKFKLLHEIGHGAANNKAIINNVTTFKFILIVNGIIMLIHSNLNVISIILIIVYFIIITKAFLGWEQQVLNTPLLEEVNADNFAIRRLTDAERQFLAGVIAKYPNALFDATMTEERNYYRRKWLLQDIENCDDKESDKLYNNIPMNILIWTTPIVLIIPLFFSKTIDMLSFIVHVLFLIIIPTLQVMRATFWKQVFHRNINHLLDKLKNRID